MTNKDLSSYAVVITGLGICTPLGRNENSFVEAILSDQSRIAHATSFDGSGLVSDLVSEFAPDDVDFGLTPELLASTDRGAWFALAAARQALASARLDPGCIPSHRLAVVVGTSHSGIQHTERIFKRLLGKQIEMILPHEIHAAQTNHAAIMLCGDLQAKGICLTISSACASSNTALGIGYDLLRADCADAVVVVGTDTVSESIVAGFNCLRAVSRQAAAPFSTPAGISLGEGAGAVVLERLADARRRDVEVHAEILGYALSGDAFHETATDLEGRGVEAAIRGALNNAGVEAAAIDYVSAHGTGTDANDIPESWATARIFGEGIPTSSPKSFMGHTLGASGIIELLLTLLLAERGMLPPTQNFKGLRPGCANLDYVPNKARAGRCETFICNNYGFGGNNSSLVVSRRIGVHTPPLRQRKRVVLSAYGLQLPGGDTRATWLNRIATGASTIVLDEDSACRLARITPMVLDGKLRPFARSSPMIKFALKAVGELFEGSDLVISLKQQPLATGLVGGVTCSAHRALEKFMESVFVDGAAFASATQFPMTTMNATAGQVSIAYGIKGYNTTFSGSAAALHYAVQALELGYQQRMIVFGADELTPNSIALERHLRMQAAGTPRQSDYVFAEGAVALLLEEKESAHTAGRDILATVAGQALTQDGTGGHAVAADGDGMARAMKAALAQAGLDADAMGSICLATEQDPARAQAQMNALLAVFGEHKPQQLDPCPIYGHATAAFLPLLLSLAAEAVRGRVSGVAGGKASLVVHTSLSGEHFAAVLVAP